MAGTGASFGSVASTQANVIVLAPLSAQAVEGRASVAQGAATHLAALSDLLASLLYEVRELHTSGAMPDEVEQLVLAAGNISGSLDRTTKSLLIWHQADTGHNQPAGSANNSA